jgi:AcrR family transcriptional regulator
MTSKSKVGETKRKILDGAERLFAARGYRGTSLREVTREAEVNLASVNYHFGSKAGLMKAVLERRVAPINAARLARLDALEARMSPPGVADLVRVFVAPPILHYHQLGDEGQAVIRLLGRSHTDPEAVFQDFIQEHFEVTIQRFHGAFSQSLPELAPEVITFRLVALVGIFTFFLHSRPPAMEGIPHPNLEPEQLINSIVAFALPGFLEAG